MKSVLRRLINGHGLCCVSALVITSLLTGCRSGHKNSVATLKEWQLFWLTNSVMEGEGTPVQVLKSKFGLGILPRRHDVTVSFGTNGTLLVAFDENTLKPLSIMLTLTSQQVFDANADGMPDMRQTKGETKQLYYQGQWYDYKEEGDNNVITFEGKALKLFFDGKNWREAPSGPTPRPRPSAPRREAKSLNG